SFVHGSERSRRVGATIWIPWARGLKSTLVIRAQASEGYGEPMARHRHDHEHDLHRDEKVKMDLDPEVALRALLEVGEPEADPRRKPERDRARKADGPREIEDAAR